MRRDGESRARPSGRERRDGNIRSDEFQSVLFELHVADNFGAKWPGRVSENRAAETGMKFFCDRSATRLRATFEDQRFVSRFGQVEGSDQPVVAAADDDYIALVGHLCCSLVFENFESREPSWRAHNAAAGVRG